MCISECVCVCVCARACVCVCVDSATVAAAVAVPAAGDLWLINTEERYKLRNNYSDTKLREIKRGALGDYE